MKVFAFFVMFAILGSLFTLGLVGLLAEPVDMKFNVFEFTAIKVVALMVLYCTYKGFVAVVRLL